MTALACEGWATRVVGDVLDAVVGLDGDRMRAEILAVVADQGTDTVVTEVLLPVMRLVGERWEEGSLSVMHEHHASEIVRSVVAEIGQRPPAAGGRAVVLTCPPAELHDLPLHLFAVMLRERGVRPIVLGANTPWRGIAAAVRALSAPGCVIAARRPTAFTGHSAGLRQLARSTSVYLAGPAALDCVITGTTCLPSDWREAADLVAGSPVTSTVER